MVDSFCSLVPSTSLRFERVRSSSWGPTLVQHIVSTDTKPCKRPAVVFYFHSSSAVRPEGAQDIQDAQYVQDIQDATQDIHDTAQDIQGTAQGIQDTGLGHRGHPGIAMALARASGLGCLIKRALHFNLICLFYSYTLVTPRTSMTPPGNAPGHPGHIPRTSRTQPQDIQDTPPGHLGHPGQTHACIQDTTQDTTTAPLWVRLVLVPPLARSVFGPGPDVPVRASCSWPQARQYRARCAQCP